MKFEKFIKEMELDQCRFCKNFALIAENDYISCCNTYNNDDPFSSCEGFQLDDALADLAEFYYNYK